MAGSIAGGRCSNNGVNVMVAGGGRRVRRRAGGDLRPGRFDAADGFAGQRAFHGHRLEHEHGGGEREAAAQETCHRDLAAVRMEFQYKDWFPAEPNVGYETLLYDVMVGDATLFQRADMVEAGWSVVSPMLDLWKALPPRSFPNYSSGSWGPKESDELLERDGRHWRNFER